MNGADKPLFTNGIEMLYQKEISKNGLLAFPLRFGVIKVMDDLNNRNIGNLDITYKYRLGADSQMVQPYIHAGGGIVIEKLESTNYQITAGAGVNFKVTDQSIIQLQGELRPSFQEDRHNVLLGLGLVYRFAKADRDMDGIVDHLDKCPDEIGTLEGCPDTDGDKIPDHEDQCPDTPGRRNTGGCPDTDRDGVADHLDLCPEVAGDFGGCPDSDGDGVGDGLDKCPQRKGRIEMDGCPDTDGDGIPDPDDGCPNENGLASNNGCPIKDTDGDGIADEIDLCPNDRGPLVLNGCPDTDGDGVLDKIDRCPDKPGSDAGCPDTDGDGLNDADDGCPDQVGPATNRGCPELKQEEKEVLDLATKAVQFQTGSATLLDVSYNILDQIADLLIKYPGYNIRISGHTDNTGDEVVNQELSRKRALACFNYLLSQGIAEARMTHFGFGSSLPVAPNTSEDGRKLNRRVEFELYVK